MTKNPMIKLTQANYKTIKAKTNARKTRRKANAKFQAKISGKKKKPNRKRLVAQLDKIFSLFIRIRDKRENGGLCVFGCGRPIQCVFHFITRTKHIVRWDTDNAVGSCAADNYIMEFNPHPYIQWYLKKHGQEKYDNLIERSNKIANFSIGELETMRDEYKKKIERRLSHYRLFLDQTKQKSGLLRLNLYAR